MEKKIRSGRKYDELKEEYWQCINPGNQVDRTG